MRIEVDSYFDVNGRYVWTPERRDEAWRLAMAKFTDELSRPGVSRAVLVVGVPGAGKSTWAQAADREDEVLFDAVFSTKFFRAKAVQIAQAAGVPIDVVWLDTPLEECLRRNTVRREDRRIPDTSILQFAKNFEGEPPTPAEGFRAVERLSGT